SRFVLHREKHFHYLKRGLRQLTEAYECLDASRPWLCYWILHSLELLDEPIPQAVASDVCEFLRRCQSPQGGFGGGPGQHPHLAPTYAAVNALCIIGTQQAFDVIDRCVCPRRVHLLRHGSLGHPQEGASAEPPELVGERGALLPVALSWGCWLGGRGWCPLLRLCPVPLCATQRWVTSRQMRFEGGFQGRCNKLVDGCYSFWQAGLLPLIHRALHAQGDTGLSMSSWMFDRSALQEYILLCCQCPAGGLLDKPGKSRDFYHTCYCLSGLSIAQHFGSGDLHHELVLGGPDNRLQPTHPVYNISPEKVVGAVLHFLQQPLP
ncbi:FNTB farnesyltransferase, partial [Psilopogon haemacephalus]|nr:FNTB farnesyltransferase [Psilopogon haemacephalus]